HVAVDNQVPYYVYGNMQDDGSMRGLSTAGGRGFGGGGADDWDHPVGGCESGFTIPDPTDPNIIWATCYGDEVTRWDARTHEARSVSPWLHTLDSPPNSTKYRCHWTPPLAIDPFDHNTVYYGCQVIWKTTNAGQSWTVSSPDLSTNDPSRIAPSGGIVGDNLGQFYGEVVFAIEPSHFDAGSAYIAVDFHMMDERSPFIFKTKDFGQTWTRINSDLPGKHPLAYVKSIAEDPNKQGLLFAGTGNGFYYSQDDGGHWTSLQAGLPHAPVSWITVQKQFHDVVVSTYGRGFYILDDISVLEQGPSGGAADAAVQFVKPRDAYRWSRGSRAILNYSLKQNAQAPVQIQVLDASGAVVRQMMGGGRAGMNRAGWDLRYDGPRLIALRTTLPAV